MVNDDRLKDFLAGCLVALLVILLVQLGMSAWDKECAMRERQIQEWRASHERRP